jgi:hypothetical protein
MMRILLLLFAVVLLLGGLVGCEVEFEEDDALGVSSEYDEGAEEYTTEQFNLRVDEGEPRTSGLYDDKVGEKGVDYEPSSSSQNGSHIPPDEEKYHNPFGHGDPQPW